MDPHRTQRLAEALREELYELVNFELEDPRIGQVDIAAVELSPDGRRAIARVLLFGEESQRNQSLKVLEGARGFLKGQLAQALGLPRMPDLHFEAAAEAGSPERMEQLLRRARRGRPRDEKKPEE